jgi:hypothetical protein
VHSTQIDIVYPLASFLTAVASQGSVEPKVTFVASVIADEQSESYMVHDEIPQLVVSVFKKKVSQLVQVLD